jgi:photosystem II stability/assembly factor-like uncharacterized protein
MMRKFLIFTVLILLAVCLVYAGIQLGMPSAVKARVQVLDAKVQEYNDNNNDGTSDVAQGEIKGPDPGEGTNDNDQTFRSLAVSWRDADVVYLGTEGNGNFKSTDGGDTWSWIRSGLWYAVSIQGYGETFDIAISSTNENVVYCAIKGSSGLYPYGDFYGPYISYDAGATWELKLSDLPNAAIDSIAVDPTDSSIVYAGISAGMGHFSVYYEGGIYKSINSGDNWSRMTMSTTAYNCTYTRILVWDPQIIFAVGVKDITNPSLGLVRTTNGGGTWENINPPGSVTTIFDVSAQDADYIYALESKIGGVHVSTDGASTWRTKTQIGDITVKVSPHDKKTAFSAGYDDLLGENGMYFARKSTDAFVSSYQVFTSTNYLFDFEFARSDPDTVYISLGGYIVYKSTDSGENFFFKANLRDYIDSH